MFFEWLFFAILFLYSCLGLLLIFNKPSAKKNQVPFEPFVSVIIAARNEDGFLRTCIESMLRVDYPHHKIEIIIVDDNSDDDTRNIVTSYNDSKIIRYFTLSPNLKSRPGKAGALLFGIEKSIGEVVFITDADCRIPSTWIKGLLSYMTDEVGLVGGFTVVTSEESISILSETESLDLIYLLTAASASAQLGKAASWIGNNMAFRRRVYNQVGGYHLLGFSLIEDMALVNAVSRRTNWQVRFTADPDILIHSRPVQSLRKLINQRKRWLSGIKDIRPFGRMLLIFNFLSRIGIPICLIALSWKFVFAYMASIMIIDIWICRNSLRMLNRLYLIKYIFGFELMGVFFALVLPLSFIVKRKITWKDHRYTYPVWKISEEHEK
jgi:cellulose synthase/poly-beta-1,6-N-acetylglucosamine synthase-like glycosyltransferase